MLDRHIQKVPVVLASDNNFASYVCVCISSILQNCDEASFFHFVLLVSNDFSGQSMQLIKTAALSHDNCSVAFVDMAGAFDDAYLRTNYITKATYYRLALPSILEDCSKCLYLDSDIIVCGDLSTLLNIDLGDNYIAGVKAPWYTKQKNYNWPDKLKGLPTDRYVNAGVLLMNLDAIRRDGIDKKFTEFSKLNFDSQDQDIINAACYSKILHLPLKFNAMTKFYNIRRNESEGVFSDDELTDAWTNPLIIHYADKLKPWHEPTVEFSNRWWEALEKSAVSAEYFEAFPESRKSPVKVSVIIPFYNMEEYISCCIQSVLEQTLKEIEIILINDKSTDKSEDIVRKLEKQDERVILLQGSGNGGGAARNAALSIARGEFVAFLDSDDYYIDVKALEILYGCAKGNNVLVSCGLKQLKRPNQKNSLKHPLYRSLFIDNDEPVKVSYTEYQHDWNYTCYIFNRQMIEKNKIRFPEVPRFQDAPFFIRAMFSSKEYVITPVEFYCVRIMGHDPVSFDSSKVKAIMEGLRNDLAFSKENGLHILHWLTAMRINNEFCEAINKNLNENNYPIFKMLAEANECLSPEIIDEVQSGELPFDKLEGVYSVAYEKNLIKRYGKSNAYILEPLRQLLSKEYFQSEPSKILKTSDFNIFRKFKRGIQCVAEHGVWYTIKYAVEKLFLKIRKG